MTRAVECLDLFKVHRTAEGDCAALQGLTLHVDAGELVACLGPSGSGKSSLIAVLAGLQDASAGVARVLGHDFGRLPGRRRAVLRRALVGLVDQHAEQALPPDESIRDGIALGLALRGTPRRAAVTRAEALLERVGLLSVGGARPGELSGGERQRASVCAAVAHRPRLLLADEPTGELDAASAAGVLGLIADLAREDGAAVLLVTHDPAGSRIADRAVALRDGRLSHERRDGVQAVVVDRGGWLRVPEELLRQGGITDRAQASLQAGRVVLSPPEGLRPGDARSASARSAPERGTAAAPGARDGLAAELHAVSCRHGGRTVLAETSARFAPGTLTVVTGRSGSGKTTLLRILAGLDPAGAGHVTVGAVRLDTLDRDARARLRAADVAVVGQGLGLLGHLTALEQVCPDRETAAAWLATLGLEARARQRVSRLSAGERQRVALARALASGRRLILLDEPSSRLDEATTAHVGELLAAAAHRDGRTVVCTTHDPLVAARADHELPLAATDRGGR